MEYFQRAADGGNAVVGRWENGPKRANPNRYGSRGDVSARYSRACMLVHGREHSQGMKLGGTAEVDDTPVLSIGRAGFFLPYRKQIHYVTQII